MKKVFLVLAAILSVAASEVSFAQMDAKEILAIDRQLKNALQNVNIQRVVVKDKKTNIPSDVLSISAKISNGNTVLCSIDNAQVPAGAINRVIANDCDGMKIIVSVRNFNGAHFAGYNVFFSYVNANGKEVGSDVRSINTVDHGSTKI